MDLGLNLLGEIILLTVVLAVFGIWFWKVDWKSWGLLGVPLAISAGCITLWIALLALVLAANFWLMFTQ